MRFHAKHAKWGKRGERKGFAFKGVYSLRPYFRQEGNLNKVKTERYNRAGSALIMKTETAPYQGRLNYPLRIDLLK